MNSTRLSAVGRVRGLRDVTYTFSHSEELVLLTRYVQIALPVMLVTPVMKAVLGDMVVL